MKVKQVNDMIVSDEDINIMIVKKKPKMRYRQIIKAFYKRKYRKEV